MNDVQYKDIVSDTRWKNW